jgi:hypothetical protein
MNRRTPVLLGLTEKLALCRLLLGSVVSLSMGMTRFMPSHHQSSHCIIMHSLHLLVFPAFYCGEIH